MVAAPAVRFALVARRRRVVGAGTRATGTEVRRLADEMATEGRRRVKLAVITATLTAPAALEHTVRSVAACGSRHVVVGPAELRDRVSKQFPAVEFRAEEGKGLY